MQDSTLANKLEDMVQQVNQTEKAGSGFKIKFFDSEIEIQNEQVITQIKSIEILSESIKSRDASDEENILNTYLEIFSKYDEAIR